MKQQSYKLIQIKHMHHKIKDYINSARFKSVSSLGLWDLEKIKLQKDCVEFFFFYKGNVTGERTE